MATYFNSNPEIQGDGLQTLVLMNPGGYVGYSDSQPTTAGNLLFLNSPASFPHAPDPNSEISSFHGFLPRPPYWTPIDHTAEARAIHRLHQPLSLTLCPQQPPFVSFPGEHEIDVSPSVLEDPLRAPLGSKYLKPAQELLDEVVNVIGEARGKHFQSPSALAATSQLQITAEIHKNLSTPEKQEILLKKTKLISMLDQVEQKYRVYHHQMAMVISTFEQIAGIGSARSYTGLALQTISKQFRTLKDAINAQIRAANRSLGEEDSPEGSRIKLVDHHIRQQRALQQLGMVQHNAWRPQRGLPERAVSVLRAWLFEHFLHPYPKDSDKHMLAKQTGLTRSQVSNWFINARVRLWKPMVEEMYLEEIKEHEKSTLHSEDSPSPKKQRTPEIENDVKPSTRDDFGFSSQPDFVPGFGSYPIGTQYAGNGVSLTLGLPALSAAHQGLLGRRLEMSDGDVPDFGAAGHPPHSYDEIGIDEGKRFAAQLLPDFVT